MTFNSTLLVPAEGRLEKTFVKRACIQLSTTSRSPKLLLVLSCENTKNGFLFLKFGNVFLQIQHVLGCTVAGLHWDVMLLDNGIMQCYREIFVISQYVDKSAVFWD